MTNNNTQKNNLSPSSFNYGGDIIKSIGGVDEKLNVTTKKKEVPTKVIAPMPSYSGGGTTMMSKIEQDNLALNNASSETENETGGFFGRGNLDNSFSKGSFRDNNSPSTVSMGDIVSGNKPTLPVSSLSISSKEKSISYMREQSDSLKDYMKKVASQGRLDSNFRKIVGDNKYQEIKNFRDTVDGISEGIKGKVENKTLTFIKAGAEAVPFVTSLTNFVTGGRLDATNQARKESKSKGEYDYSQTAEVAGTIAGTFAGYNALQKFTDSALLGTTIPSKYTQVIEAQKYLKDTYVNNPKLFNFISNTAQESIDYGVNKSLGNQDTSLTNLFTGVALGGVFSAMSKTSDSLKGIASNRDMRKLNSFIEDAKLKSPDATDEEIFQSIKGFKLDDIGMTVDEVKTSLAKRTDGVTGIKSTSGDAVQSHLADKGIVVSTNGSNRLAEVLDEVNLSISKEKPEASFLTPSTSGDLRGFKQELIGSLKSGEVNTRESVDELVTTLGQKYGVKTGVSGLDYRAMDTLEEALLKPNASIQNIANPRSIDNLLSQFGYQETKKVNWDKVDNLITKVDDLTSKAKLTDIQSNELDTTNGKLKEIYDKFNIDSTSKNAYKQLQNEVYNIPKDFTTQAKRNKWIKEVTSENNKINSVMDYLSTRKTTNKEAEINLVFANQQIANILGKSEGNYLTNLKKVNTILEDIKSGKEGKYFTDAKIREGERSVTQAKILQEVGENIYNIPEGMKFNFSKKGVWVSGGFIDTLNTPYRVLKDAFGEDSEAYRVFIRNPMGAESNYLNAKSELISNATRLMKEGGLEDKSLHNKFSIYMLMRRYKGGSNEINPMDSIINSANLRKNKDGDIVNDMVKGSITSKSPGAKLSEADVNSYVSEMQKKINSTPALKELVTHLDNTFFKYGEEMNNIIRGDSNEIINTVKDYFPIRKYNNGGNDASESLSETTFDTIKSAHLNDSFLNNLTGDKRIDKYNLELDLGTLLRQYADGQMYFTHMKPEVDKMRGILGTKLEKSIRLSENGKITDVSGVFGNSLNKYLTAHIDNIVRRGTVNQNEYVRKFANGVSQATSFVTIGFNVFSAGAQPLSLVDNALFRKNTLANLNKISRASAEDAMEVSGKLRQRMTEHISGEAIRPGWDFNKPFTSIGDMVNNKDMQTMGLYGKPWNDSLTETSLRLMKRIDGATSNVVWHSAFYDKLYKDFEELQNTNLDLKGIRTKIGDVNFARIRDYADGEMENVMYQGSSIVNRQQIKSAGAVYSLNTLLMKTMVNRAFLVNDAWRNADMGWLRQSSLIGLSAGLEEARQYANSQSNIAIGEKEKYEYYDKWTTNVGDWLAKQNNTELSEEGKIILNTVGSYVNNVMGVNGLGYDYTNMFKKASDAWNSSQGDIPTVRKVTAIGEGVAMSVFPGTTKKIVAPFHQLLSGDTMADTKKDNASLQTLVKDNPDKISSVAGMSWSQQTEYANRLQLERQEANIVKEKEKPKEDFKKAITKEIVKEYGVPTKDEMQAFVNKNSKRFIEVGMGAKETTEFYKKFDERLVTMEGVDMYSVLARNVNVEVIYKVKLKPYLANKDYEGFKKEMKVLESKGIIKDRNGFIKKVNKIMKEESEVK